MIFQSVTRSVDVETSEVYIYSFLAEYADTQLGQFVFAKTIKIAVHYACEKM